MPQNSENQKADSGSSTSLGPKTREAAFTPGPWVYSTQPQPNGCPIVGARGLMVAMLAHSINLDAAQRNTALANARLIASAPELFEALRMAEAYLAPRVAGTRGIGETDILPKVRAALSKATGEGK